MPKQKSHTWGRSVVRLKPAQTYPRGARFPTYRTKCHSGLASYDPGGEPLASEFPELIRRGVLTQGATANSASERQAPRLCSLPMLFGLSLCQNSRDFCSGEQHTHATPSLSPALKRPAAQVPRDERTGLSPRASLFDTETQNRIPDVPRRWQGPGCIND